MLRALSSGFVVVALALAPASMAAAAPKKRPVHRHHVTHHWKGYGFLPGYRPPDVIARQREAHYWRSGPHYYGPAWPRFYHGRWNGGGFGPCYANTPIGYIWTCGK
jgi:hypothetical protein